MLTVMPHHYQLRLKIDRPLLFVGLRCDQLKEAVFNSFSCTDFFELTLQVCTEEDVYVQKLGFATRNLLCLRRSILALRSPLGRGLFLTDRVKPSL